MTYDTLISNGAAFTSIEWLREMNEMEHTDESLLPLIATAPAQTVSQSVPPKAPEVDLDDCCAGTRFAQLVARMAGLDEVEVMS